MGQKRRFGRAPRRLPVFTDQRAFSKSAGMSQRCQNRKSHLVDYLIGADIHDGQEHRRSKQGPARIQMRKTNPTSISSHSACNARPVHARLLTSDITGRGRS
jgi:hypothetical protein